jgi:short-subunit dehydrogenase
MSTILRAAVDAWISRRARARPEALAAVAGLAPATVVTGASRGIGLAIARRFAEAGSDVALVARARAPLEEAAAAISRDFNVKALPLVLDVAAADAPRAIDAGLAAHGHYMDCLVNNAGIGLSGPYHEHDPRDVDRLVALNIAAAASLMRHALEPMRARARGGILNVASLGGYAPGPYQAAYYASKAFVISLTEAVAYETRGEGVRIAVVAPGPVETSFHRDMGADGALYRLLVPSSTPEGVARSAYRGFVAGRRVIVPGILATISAYVLRVLPHPIAVPLVGLLLDPGRGKSDVDAPRDD